MKLRGRLVLAMIALTILGTGCSRINPAIVARADGNEGGAAGEAAVEVAAVEAGIAYQQTELQAPTDQAFTVQFTNPAALPHNWVLVEEGQAQAVADAAGPDGTIADDAAGVIKASPVIASESADVSIEEPLEAGEYTYICTVPGHYAAGMQGVLIVQ
jgi:plastocyanin